MNGEIRGEEWILSDMGEVEWHMLTQLPQAADASRSEQGRRRLFPEITGATHPEIQEDWRQFVQPEIESRFSEEIQMVVQDMQRVEETRARRGREMRRRLRIPVSHAETWYSVLNQARLILNEDHELAGTEHHLLYGSNDPAEIDEQRWLLLVQYRVYASIQEFILSQLME